MNKYIINIIKKSFPKELSKPMGRWRIENCNIQMNNKIDLSNEDHCGPCGQYALSKTELKNNQKTELKNNQKTELKNNQKTDNYLIKK
jgi:hypothetical protein